MARVEEEGAVLNPTDRSRWIVHTRPTSKAPTTRESHRPQSVDRSYLTYTKAPTNPGIPPTAVGGLFIPDLHPSSNQPGNPTDRSRWIVHTRPTPKAPTNPRIPPTAVGGSFIPSLRTRDPIQNSTLPQRRFFPALALSSVSQCCVVRNHRRR
jgi:hypothetical protein